GLNGAMEYQLERKREALQRYKTHLKYLSPGNQIREKRTFALNLEESIQEAMERILTGKRHELELYIEKLKGLSPLDKLKQGFSHTSTEQGKTVTKVSQVAQGQKINIYVSDGKIEAVVEKTEKRENGR
nr:exodeoxyribonuclease VII large subunit [Lachnospiraceae bacterium]